MQLIRLSRSNSTKKESARIINDELSALNLEEGSDKDQLLERTNYKVRQLVLSEAPWEQIESELWRQFHAQPSEELAASVLELTFIYASKGQTLSNFDKIINLRHQAFYWLLHTRLRDFVVENHSDSNVNTLYWMIANGNPDNLTGTERMFVFCRLCQSPNQETAWFYLSKNINQLVEIFNTHQICLGFTKDQFLLKAVTLATSLGHQDDAKAYCEKISSESSERDLAFEQLIKWGQNHSAAASNIHSIHLQGLRTPAEKSEYVENLCRQVRAPGNQDATNLLTLSQIYKDPLSWFGSDVEGLGYFSDVTVRNRDIHTHIPYFLNTFHQQANRFGPPEMERSLWLPVSKQNPKTNLDKYFRGVSLFHLFLASPNFNEVLLWESREIFLSLANDPHPDRWMFADLAATAISHVNSHDFQSPTYRDTILCVLRLVLHYDQATAEHFESYLKIASLAAKPFIDQLASRMLSLGRISTLHAIVSYYTRIHGLSNDFLDRLWTLANHQHQYDLAWRVASVVSARQALDSSIMKAWEISGEKRSSYSANQFGSAEFETAMFGLSDKGKRFIRSLALLGGPLSQLTFLVRKSDVTSNPCIRPFSAIEKVILNNISTSGYLSKSMKETYSGTKFAHCGGSFANLLFHVDKNPWIFASSVLLERLALSSWNSQIETLRQLTDSVHPLVGGRTMGHSSHKIGRWISNLSSPQRTAWSDLQTLVRDIDQDETIGFIAVFVAQAATLLYPSHYLGLISLQKAGFPLYVIRCLENFLLSGEYSTFRHKRSIHSRVVVPKTFGGRSILRTEELSTHEDLRQIPVETRY